MKRLAFLVLLLLLAGAAPARAAVPIAWQRKALDLSVAVFHPSCGPLAIVFGDASAVVAKYPPGGANEPQAGQIADRPTGWATTGVCVINIDRSYYWLGYPEFCRVVLHEAGNVVGYDDDWSKPNSIRYPAPFITKGGGTANGHRVTRWTGVDPRCLPSRHERSAASRAVVGRVLEHNLLHREHER